MLKRHSALRKITNGKLNGMRMPGSRKMGSYFVNQRRQTVCETDIRAVTLDAEDVYEIQVTNSLQ